MHFFASIALLALSLQLAACAPEKMDCSKVNEALDDLGGAQGLTTLNDKYKLQTSVEEHQRRCSEMADAIKTLRKYNRDCFTSLTQQVFSALLRTRSQINELRCKDPASAEFKETVEATKCIQENSFETARDAERKTIVGMQVLHDANISDDKVRVKRACCAVLDAKRFFVEGTKAKCSKYENTYKDYVDSYTSEAMGLICPEPEKLECDKLPALKTEGVEPKSKFFLIPMVNLVKSLDH